MRQSSPTPQPHEQMEPLRLLRLILCGLIAIGWAVVLAPPPSIPIPAWPTRLRDLVGISNAAWYAMLWDWLHTAPRIDQIAALARAGTALIGAELGFTLLRRVATGLVTRRAQRVVLHVRMPAIHPQPDLTKPALLQALLHVFPLATGWPTRSKGRVALMLFSAPSGVIQQGIAVMGMRRSRQEALIATIRRIILAHYPHAEITIIPDPLREHLRTAQQWHAQCVTWRQIGPPELPLPSASVFTDLISALRPPAQGYSEWQLVIHALPLTANEKGWRRAALTRLTTSGDKLHSATSQQITTHLANAAGSVALRTLTLTPADQPQLGAILTAQVQQALRGLHGFVGRTERGITVGSRRTVVIQRDARLPACVQEIVGLHPPPRLPLRVLLPLPEPIPPLLSLPVIQALWQPPHAYAPTELAMVRWRLLPAPSEAFLPILPPNYCPDPFLPLSESTRIVLGYARTAEGQRREVGPLLSDLRTVLHLTAGMGAGKSRLLANLCGQFAPFGFCLIDGKGDDVGGLSAHILRHIRPEDEARVVILDPSDADWPIMLNPLAMPPTPSPTSIDRIVSNVLSLFARIDPERWQGSVGMQEYLDKAVRLVLAGEAQPTLAHVKQVLLDPSAREPLLAVCRNPDVRDFWQQQVEQLSEANRTSRDALIRRFDKLLGNALLRLPLSLGTRPFDFATAIAERSIIIAPIKHVALGEIAELYAMLLFQQLVRAAFARPGSSRTREDYPVVIDEVQVMLNAYANTDLTIALSQLRAFAIPLVLAHQTLDQLGPLANLVQINAENRVILKTREPDASVYAHQYRAAGVTASDISNQEPTEHQYAVFQVMGRSVGPFSLEPLPWPSAEVTSVIRLPKNTPMWTDILPQTIPADEQRGLHLAQRILYAHLSVTEQDALIDRLCALPEAEWEQLRASCAMLQTFHLSLLQAQPEHIPHTLERLRWTSRLRYATPRILAEAQYQRVRRAIPPVSLRPASHTARAAPAAQLPAPEPPAFSTADRAQSPRLPREPHYPRDDDDDGYA